jgi:hypothetical protein
MQNNVKSQSLLAEVYESMGDFEKLKESLTSAWNLQQEVRPHTINTFLTL